MTLIQAMNLQFSTQQTDALWASSQGKDISAMSREEFILFIQNHPLEGVSQEEFASLLAKHDIQTS
jgi:hypothetical protein